MCQKGILTRPKNNTELLTMFSVSFYARVGNDSKSLDVRYVKNNNLIFKLARLGLNRSKNIPYLLIGVVWCFSSLILVITYTSLLTSYITAPSTQYLIKSVQELVDRPDIWIVTDKNRNSESLMLVSLR